MKKIIAKITCADFSEPRETEIFLFQASNNRYMFKAEIHYDDLYSSACFATAKEAREFAKTNIIEMI